MNIKQALRRARARRLVKLHWAIYLSALVTIAVTVSLLRVPLPHAVLWFQALWGFGLLLHWLIVLQPAKAAPPAAERMWEQAYEPRALIDYDDDPLAALRLAVDAELPSEIRRRRAVYLRVSVLAVFTAILLAWLIIPALFGPFTLYGDSALLGLLTLSLSGLLSLGLQRQSAQLDTPAAQRRLRQELLARLLDEWGMHEKPKRRAYLEDDGEIDLDALLREDSASQARGR